MENGEAGGQILIIRRILAEDQERRGLDDGFMDVVGTDTVVKLNI